MVSIFRARSRADDDPGGLSGLAKEHWTAATGRRRSIRADPIARPPRRPQLAPSQARGCSASGRVSSTSSPSPPTVSNGRGGRTSRCPLSRAPSRARAGMAGCSSASRIGGRGHDEGARKIRRMIRKQRCAVYTRKSSEEGLEQEFNSLHAQREACEAYIASQRSEGWVLVRDQYDDGGISGGTL